MTVLMMTTGDALISKRRALLQNTISVKSKNRVCNANAKF